MRLEERREEGRKERRKGIEIKRGKAVNKGAEEQLPAFIRLLIQLTFPPHLI